MKKRVIAFAIAATTVGGTALAVAPVASAASHGGACVLSGTASFDGAGLTGTGGPFTYSFSGTLSNCQSSSSGAPTGGSVFAGLNGLNHSTGSGGCSQSTTAGESIIQWNDGKTTVIKYTTTGAAAAVALQGTVVAATTETDPLTLLPLYTTNEPSTPVGDSSLGQLTFGTTSPQDCALSGLKSASINGLVEVGSPS